MKSRKWPKGENQGIVRRIDLSDWSLRISATSVMPATVKTAAMPSTIPSTVKAEAIGCSVVRYVVRSMVACGVGIRGTIGERGVCATIEAPRRRAILTFCLAQINHCRYKYQDKNSDKQDGENAHRKIT
jgi:hypothetical protein